MALTDSYVPADMFVSAFGAVPDRPTLERQLKACSRLFEREAGQFFNQDDSAVARVFEARYSDVLEVWGDVDGCPGIASTSGLAIKVDTDGDGSFADETAWASTDYELLPRNAALGPDARPYDRITVPRWSTKSFTPGLLVQVTAIWGWPAVPAAVEEDVMELCRIWRAESPRSTSSINELDQVLAVSAMGQSLVARIRDAYRGKVAL